MTAYLAGLALLRCEEHPRADEIDSTSRLALAAMASFVSKEREQAGEPLCYASQTTIGARCNLHRTVVHKATRRLGDLGLIERVESRQGVPVHWRLTLVAGSRPVAESDTSNTGDLSLSATPPVARDDTPCSAEQHNPSDSSRPPGREGGGRSDAADAAASAGATATAATPSSGEGTLVDEVRTALGCTAEHAEQWITEKIAASSSPVRNRTAWIRKCLAADAEQRTAKAAGARTAKAGKSAPPAKAARPRLRGSVSDAEQRDAVARARGGEPVESIAAQMSVRVDRVSGWVRDMNRSDAREAVLAGDQPAAVALRFGVEADLVRGYLRRGVRLDALASLRAGRDAAQVAERATARIGEPITAETVRGWFDESEAQRRRGQRMGLAA